MKTVHVLVTFLFLFFSTQISAQDFRAILSGRGEVPPVKTHAYGEVNATLNGDTLTVTGSFHNLIGEFAHHIAGGSHLHMNYAGRNGGIAHELHAHVDSALHSGGWEADSNKLVLTQEQKEALFERALYVNIHTSFSASGEIRGQLVPEADAYYTANLSGSNENPAVLTDAHGSIIVDVLEDTVTISGSFNALGSQWNGGLHLHTGFAGQNGPVSIPINGTVDSTGRNGIITAASNRFTLTPEQKEALRRRQMYCNVHTQNFAPGEIRGQLTEIVPMVFRAHLSGMNEIPFVSTRAGGMLIAELSADSTLSLSGSFAGIRSKVATDIAGGAHIHQGVAGRNGAIQLHVHTEFNNDSTGGSFQVDDNAFQLSAEQYSMLLNRGLYLNVHSNVVRSGEIRGQILPESPMVFSVNISSVTSIPPVRSSGIGLVKAELNGDALTLTGSINGLGSEIDTMIAGGGHIHIAPAGSTGPVIAPLNLRFDGTDMTQAVLGNNVVMLDSLQREALLARGLYINVHTHRYPAGEVRGQLLPEARNYFAASLAGTNEAVPVNSAAWGQLLLEVQQNNQGTASGSFNNLAGELAINIAGGAHLHTGLAGQNGPVRIPVHAEPSPDMRDGVFIPSANVLSIPEGLADTIMDYGTYMNVHSSFSASGEIRGQLLPLANAHVSTVLRSANEVQPVATAGHGSAYGIISGSTLTVTGTFAELTGDFAEEIAGGSHIHNARAGFNGPIAVPLEVEVSGDLKSGVYRSDTTYGLTAQQVAAFLDGSMYFNIHTSEYNSGELRGQVLSVYNEYPDATSEITQPVPNSTVTVRSDAFEPLFIAWTPSMDEDSLAYIIQVSPDPTFSVIPIQLNTGNIREFSALTLAFIDTLLADFGIPIGFPLSVNARVIASDGSLQSIGEASSFTVVREPASSLKDLPEGWRFEAYPAPASTFVRIDIVAPGVEDPSLVMISADGQRIAMSGIERAGDRFVTDVNLGGMAPGLWIVALEQDGVMLATRKILVVR